MKMEMNKVPTSTSTTVAATSVAVNPLVDPVALQTTYLAAVQLHNQLQQNPHLAAAVDTAAVPTSTITTTSANNVYASLYKTTTPACLPTLAGNDRLNSVLPSQLQQCLKQQQQQSINTSLVHHFSAFSPINADLLSAAVSTAPSLLTHSSSLPTVPSTASQQQTLDLFLMQMQMATAAAAATAGFFPNAFNVLPPVTASALGMLAPQFRMLQLSDPNFSSLTNTAGLFAVDVMSKGDSDASVIERSLLQAQINLLTNGSLLSAVNEHTCGNGTVSEPSSHNVISSLVQQLNPSLNHNSSHNNNRDNNHNDSKQQRMQLKRSCDEMSILRSLCSENHTIEQDTAMIRAKRSKLAATDESGRQDLQKSAKACNSGKNQPQQQKCFVEFNSKDLSDGNPRSRKGNAEKHVTSGLFDENSRNRHHPLNHRPPAMEARFLECMAAIALHSNIPLPVSEESMVRRSTDVDGTRIGKNGGNGKSEEHEQSVEDELRSISSPGRSGFNENNSITTVTSSASENRKYWPNSAIDEELCKELENYKDTDISMIHAFVLPSKFPDSTLSPVSDGKCSQGSQCTVVPESITVPIPVLNTLLDRILQTMLDS